MPFNYKGDLYKGEIAQKLKEKGCNINNIHDLNLIMEKMGLLRQNGSHWMTTENGLKHTIYSRCGEDCNAWHPEVVDLIYKFIKREK